MALPSKLYRFKIELSDLEKGSYESLDFRVAQHPSESLTYMLTRVLAYVLSHEEGIEFSPGGLSDPDAPCIRILNIGGSPKVWIEIGNPSARKIHRASKAAEKVKIYTYKDPQVLLNELNSEPVHRKEELDIFSISSKFLEELEAHTKKDNKWTIINMDGAIMVNGEGFDLQCDVKRHQA
ncbi:YaeQ family protein [bacterium]|nr:YaeQ family protein [bacterium]